MAVFVVAFSGTRLADAETTTGWTSDGVSPGIEPDFFYQGANSISAQIKTSEAGFYFTSASTDMTGKSWLAKVYSGKIGSLTILRLRVGSTIANYHDYDLFTSTTYPNIGGWQLFAIDPNVAQWRSSTLGTPVLTATTIWWLRAQYSATSRSTNTAVDAIDVITNGSGLSGVGGDGAGPAGNFQSFINADEGTSNNRWGVVTSKSGILYLCGTLLIGSSTATVFMDSNKVVVIPDQKVTTGFSGIKFALSNATSAFTLTNCLFNGKGTLYTTDDTRPDYTVTGVTGACTFSGCTFNGFRQITLTSVVSSQACNFLNGLNIIGAGADLRTSGFSGCTGAADASYLTWDVVTDVDGKLDGSTFTKGTTATHAVELGTSSPTSVTFRNVTFSGYNGANGQTDSAIYVRRTTGTVTINIVGGTTPSYKTDGATVNIVANPVTASVKVVNTSGTAIQNARVLLKASSGGPFPSGASVSITRSGSTATVTHTSHGLSTNDYVVIKGASQIEYNGVFLITVVNTNSYTYTVSGTPATPATGTITSTFAVLTGLTDASGNISMSRVFPADQPVTGTARIATTAPYYKPGGITGTVSSSTGFSATVQLVADQ